MLDIDKYNYFLPKNLIANKPAAPRDLSKLLVYDTKTDKIYLDRFFNLDKYLSPKSFLVMNDTKVIPARITLKKANGAKVKVLFLVNEKLTKNTIRGYVNKRINLGDKLYFDKLYCVNTIKQEESIFVFSFDFPIKKLIEILEKKGKMPIPLYIKNSPLSESELKKKYQTVFAKKKGSTAAPTASLHFTRRLFNKLENQDIKKFFLTLYVGLGTFAPVSEKNIRAKKLHEEYYEIDINTLKQIETYKNTGGKLVAVGTTVVRALEGAKSNFGSTDLFIFPPYSFKTVDGLITNFHLPKSSLMMLVEAFLQHKSSKRTLIELYRIAIDNNFRFYSFGDGMYIK